MLTQKELKKELHYEPTTGIFTRLHDNFNIWHRGDIAGHKKGRKNYIGIPIDRTAHYAHRLAWLYVYGYWPKDQIHHINNISNDNRIANLKETTNAKNHRCKKLYACNRSGFNGVGWNKHNKAWQARISINGKSTHLGLFKDLQDAIQARKDANVKYGYDINHGMTTANLDKKTARY